MKANYPNPFNPNTTIRFDIPAINKDMVMVNLSIYDMVGKKVTTLINEPLSPNAYTVKWNGQNELGHVVPTGIYFYVLKSEYFIDSHKMILVK